MQLYITFGDLCCMHIRWYIV